MHKKNVYLSILILTCIFLTSLFTTASAQTPPPEADCRYCHENINPAITISAMHHDKTDTIIPDPTDAPYGTPGNLFECVSCHETQSSCGGVTYIIETDCTVCHVAADPHHMPVPTSCALCHESVRPADPHPQGSDCSFCHSDPGGSWQFETYNHTPDTSSCILCHESERPADPHPPTRDCAECHLDVGNFWLGAIYDHIPAPTFCALLS